MSKYLMPCLVITAVTAALLLAFGVSLARLAPIAIVLACPLGMLLMMRMMGGHTGSREGHPNVPRDH